MGAKTWNMYTRPVASSTPSKNIASGPFTGDPSKTGDLILTDSDDAKYSQTVTIVERSDGKLIFNGNVAPAHKFIGAHDEK